jgi:ketosteroid isomerase-like protein
MEPIVKTLLEVLDSFNREDFAALAELVDPEVVYRIPGRMPFSGEHRGVEAVTAALRQLPERSGGTIAVKPRTVLTDGEHVMFTARVSAQHNGRTLDVVNAYHYRFSGGKMVEAQVFPGDLHHVEAFFTE